MNAFEARTIAEACKTGPATQYSKDLLVEAMRQCREFRDTLPLVDKWGNPECEANTWEPRVEWIADVLIDRFCEERGI